jgi:hypothetical protein
MSGTNKIVSKGFPFDYYRDMIKQNMGRELSDQDESFLSNFACKNTLSSSKQAYYYALFYYKRFYPLFVIRILIRKKIKWILAKEEASPCIQSLYKEITEIVLLTAMSTYAKGGKHDE